MPAIPLPTHSGINPSSAIAPPPLKDLPSSKDPSSPSGFNSIYSASIFNLLDESKSPAPESLVIWRNHAYILRNNTLTQLLLPNASYSFDPSSMTLHGPCRESSSAPVRFFWQGKELDKKSFEQLDWAVDIDAAGEIQPEKLEKKADVVKNAIAQASRDTLDKFVGQPPSDLLSLDKEVEIMNKQIFEALKIPPSLLPSPRASISNFDNRSISFHPDSSITISYPPNKNARFFSDPPPPYLKNLPTSLSLDSSRTPTKLTINYTLSICYLANDDYTFTQFTPAPSFPSFPFPTYQLNNPYYFVAISPQNEVYIITNSPSSDEFHVSRLDGHYEIYNSQGQLHSTDHAASQFPYGKNLSYFLNGIPLTQTEWEVERNIIKEAKAAENEKIPLGIIDSAVEQEQKSQDPPKPSLLARSLISSIPTIPSALLSLFPSQFSKELRVNALSKSLSSSIDFILPVHSGINPSSADAPAPPPASSRISLIDDNSSSLYQIVDYVDLLNSPQSSNSSS